MKQVKRVGAFIYMPLLFLFFGYFCIYIIGAPVINFARSAIELISLNDAPTFEKIGTNLFAEREANDQYLSDENTANATESNDAQSNDENALTTSSSIQETGESINVPSSQIVYPTSGDQFGKIVIDKVGINEPLYYGDSEEILRVGVGQYIGSIIPGELGTTLVGGHNMPSFGKIYYLKAGDIIKVYTHYGDYHYQVTGVRVANYQDPLVNEKLGDYSKRSLLLYTCYPLDAIGVTPERAFVFADLISGPIIDEAS